VGQPYYWSWAPDGKTMLVNVGGPGETDPNAHLAFLYLSEKIQERRLDLSPHHFRAPAWSPKGEHLLLAAESEAGEGILHLTDQQGVPIRELASYQGQVAFSWSPDGERLAYLATDTSNPEDSGKLKILALDEAVEAISSPEQGVAAFFWSPDSRRIAYMLQLEPPEDSQSSQGEGQQNQAVGLQLNILEIGSGETRTIAAFQPTQQFLAILQTFDQFQRSNTIWSPNSEYLVLSAINQEGVPGIWVVPASGRLPPRFITPGIIGFWSWN
jgi:Tol biopolymer transport system component